MKQPDLRMLAKWLDPTLVMELEKRRRLKNEWQRNRKLATLQTLWLMLAVSLDTQRRSLFEILRLATGTLDIKWSVSVASFCKARARFSPEQSDLVVRSTRIADTNSLQTKTASLAWSAFVGRRQDNAGVARDKTPLEALRRAQGTTGLGANRRRALLSV